MLRRLLTAKNEEEKSVISKLTHCIKYMHQNYDIDQRKWIDIMLQTEAETSKGG